MKYIEKSALVAAIERRVKLNETCQEISVRKDFYLGAIDEAKEILSFLNTFEVKEVDLEKEINLWVEDNTCRGYCSADIRETAEHFFELGLKTKGGEK